MVGLLAYLGMTALGTWMNARGQVKAGNAQNDLAYFNAKIAGLRAQDAIERGAEEEARFRMGIQQVIGTAIAGFAGQNVDVGIGSALDVGADAAYLGEMDAQMIRANAAREAWGYRVEAASFLKGGQQALSQGKYNAANTVLGTATSLLAAKYQFGG